MRVPASSIFVSGRSRTAEGNIDSARDAHCASPGRSPRNIARTTDCTRFAISSRDPGSSLTDRYAISSSNFSDGASHGSCSRDVTRHAASTSSALIPRRSSSATSESRTIPSAVRLLTRLLNQRSASAPASAPRTSSIRAARSSARSTITANDTARASRSASGFRLRSASIAADVTLIAGSSAAHASPTGSSCGDPNAREPLACARSAAIATARTARTRRRDFRRSECVR